MSFHESCELIRIEVRGDHTVLLAAAGNGDGDDEFVPAELTLDDGIGNLDGYFSPEASGFTESAEDIQLEVHEDGPWLTADLTKSDGEYRERQGINLALYIGNQGGELVWI